MDRFRSCVPVSGLGLLLLMAAGCRTTQPEVPPGRPFARDGQQRQAIQFSQQGNQVQQPGSAPMSPRDLGNSDLGQGIDAQTRRMTPTDVLGSQGVLESPGTSPRSSSPTPGSLSDPSAQRASAPSPGAGSVPLTGTPPPGVPPLNLPPFKNPTPPAGNAAPSASSAPADSDTMALPDLNVPTGRDAVPPASSPK